MFGLTIKGLGNIVYKGGVDLGGRHESWKMLDVGENGFRRKRLEEKTIKGSKVAKAVGRFMVGGFMVGGERNGWGTGSRPGHP